MHQLSHLPQNSRDSNLDILPAEGMLSSTDANVQNKHLKSHL